MTTLEDIAELALQTEVEKTEAEAAEARLNLLTRLSSHWTARRYLFDGPIDFASIAKCIDTLDSWRRLDADRPDKKMHIIFNGSAYTFHALALHDYLRWLRLDGFEVTVEIAGCAFDQAALLLEAADRRVMTESSILSIAEAPREVTGNTFDAENLIEITGRLDRQLRRLLARRSHFSTSQIGSRIKLKSWIVESTEALERGLIDEISSSLPAPAVLPVSYELADIPAAENLKEKLQVAKLCKARYELALAQLKHRDHEAEALNNGVVRFIETVTTTTVGKAKSDLESALRLSNSDITLLIDSNGGSCTDGLGFIDMCRQVRASGRVLNTEVVGYAASMGGIMLQCGKKRTMGRESWLLIHRASSWFGDTNSKAQLSYERTTILQRLCFAMLAERSVFTTDEVLERCRDHDWWITAEEALKYGFIDEIR